VRYICQQPHGTCLLGWCGDKATHFSRAIGKVCCHIFFGNNACPDEFAPPTVTILRIRESLSAKVYSVHKLSCILLTTTSTS